MIRGEFAMIRGQFAADIRKFAKGSHSDIHKFTAHSRRVREFADGYTRVRESPRRACDEFAKVRNEFATSSRVRKIPQVRDEFAKVIGLSAQVRSEFAKVCIKSALWNTHRFAQVCLPICGYTNEYSLIHIRYTVIYG